MKKILIIAVFAPALQLPAQNIFNPLSQIFFPAGNNPQTGAKFLGISQAFTTRHPQRLKGKVGIDGIGTVSDKQAMMMNLTCLAGLKNEPDLGA